jgi:hypothetical protein
VVVETNSPDGVATTIRFARLGHKAEGGIRHSGPGRYRLTAGDPAARSIPGCEPIHMPNDTDPPAESSHAKAKRTCLQVLHASTACSRESSTRLSCNRDGGIRTRDPLNPIQVRYRTALRPVQKTGSEIGDSSYSTISDFGT